VRGQLELLALGGQTVVSVRFIGQKDEEIITPKEAVARDQTDWERVDEMTDEELTQNALDDPDNPPLEDNKQRWKLPAGTILGVNYFPEEDN
jgi:hypothetical protein